MNESDLRISMCFQMYSAIEDLEKFFAVFSCHLDENYKSDKGDRSEYFIITHMDMLEKFTMCYLKNLKEKMIDTVKEWNDQNEQNESKIERI